MDDTNYLVTLRELRLVVPPAPERVPAEVASCHRFVDQADTTSRYRVAGGEIASLADLQTEGLDVLTDDALANPAHAPTGCWCESLDGERSFARRPAQRST